MSSINKPFSSEFQLEIQEKMLLKESSSQKLSIGIPKEDFRIEKRIPLTPFAVKLLTDNGIIVFVESGAGEASSYSDIEYSESGAEILEQQEMIFKADVIIKVAPPSLKQIEFLSKNQLLISSLNVKTLKKQYFKKLTEKKVTAIAIEYIKDELENYPFVQFMSEITGRVAIDIASNFLKEKKGKLIGRVAGNTPSEIIVIGAGDVARSAIEAAINVGAVVKVFDNSVSRLKELESYFPIKIYTSLLYPAILEKEFPRADIVIGALHEGVIFNSVISKELIKSMRADTIVIDLTIDQGLCFETSKLTSFDKPTFEINNVTHYGVPNVPSTVPRTASNVLSNIFLHHFSNLQNHGSINYFLKNDIYFRNGLYFYNGILVNKSIGEIFDLPYKDINLILAAF